MCVSLEHIFFPSCRKFPVHVSMSVYQMWKELTKCRPGPEPIPALLPRCASLFTWDRGVLSQHVTSARVNTHGGGYTAFHTVLSPPAFVPKPLSHRETSCPYGKVNKGADIRLFVAARVRQTREGLRRGGGVGDKKKKKRGSLLILAGEGQPGGRVRRRWGVFRQGEDMGECLGSLG